MAASRPLVAALSFFQEIFMSNAAVKPSREAIPVGIEGADRKHLAELLEKALSDTYVLYAKIQGVHWNVAGPLFLSVHKMTEEQYEDLAESIDHLAQRIRALGYLAPTKLARFLELSDKSLREAVSEADNVDDVFTAYMLTARIGRHENFAWMLRALAAKPS
jgi:starvation-inducible DNA-binding protein